MMASDPGAHLDDNDFPPRFRRVPWLVVIIAIEHIEPTGVTPALASRAAISGVAGRDIV